MTDGLVHRTVPFRRRDDDPGPNEIDIWVRKDVQSDFDVIYEAFSLDEYNIRDLANETWAWRSEEEPGATVIDVGANIGAVTLLALQFGAASVVAVEPEVGNLAVLRHNVGAHHRGGDVQIIPAAVARTAGVTSIAGEAGQAHNVGESDGTAVETVTLAEIIDSVTGPIALLKIDIEGGEYDALDACPADRFARCERIAMEWHGPAMCPWIEQAPIGALVQKLLETHDTHVWGDPARGGFIAAHRYPA